MTSYTGDLNEKILELQEGMQQLQILKQIGAEKLILEQEKKIYNLQRDIMDLNNDMTLDPVDAILPKKCRYCSDKSTDEERLECYEENYSKCQKKEPMHVGSLSMAVIKMGLMYGIVLLLLFTFLLFTNIFMSYVDNRIIVFVLSGVSLAIIILIFNKPMKRLMKMIS